MKAWLTIAELVGLPGLPRSQPGLQKLATRENWAWRPREGRGGGREYDFAYLPAETRRALAARELAIAKAATPIRRLDGADKLIKLQKLSGWKKDKAQLLIEIWQAIDAHHKTAGCSWEASLQDYNSGAIAVSEAARAARRTISWPTFERMRAKVNKDGLAGLAPNYGNRDGAGVIDTTERNGVKLSAWVVGVMLKEPQIRARHLHERLQVEWPEISVSETRLAAWIKAWKADNASDWLRQTNPDAWKNRFAPAFGSHFEDITELNQLWEMDSSPADWMLVDGRHTVIQCVDLFTRRRRLLVSKTSNGLAIGLLFRRCALAWGVPQGVRTDQGLDYAGTYVETLLDTLNIEQDRCDAYESQQKGTVERGFRTIFHSILETLPGFVGHNVAERKAIESRKSFAARRAGESAIEVKMTSVELQKKLDEWCEFLYERRAQEALGNRSPFQVATEWRGTLRTIDERALDMLLMPIAGERTVSKGRGIQWDTNEYVHPQLGTWIGAQVLCRHDPANVGHLYVYSLQNEFICLAECPELLGISRKEIAIATNALVKAHNAKRDAELRELRRDIKRNSAEVVIEARRAEAGVVSMFPHATTPHVAPALDAAAKAAAARTGHKPAPPPMTERAQEIHAQLQAGTYQPQAPRQTRAPTPEEDAARWFARLERFESALAAGEPVSDMERAWAERFKKQPIYTARARLRGELGAAQA